MFPKISFTYYTSYAKYIQVTIKLLSSIKNGKDCIWLSKSFPVPITYSLFPFLGGNSDPGSGLSLSKGSMVGVSFLDHLLNYWALPIWSNYCRTGLLLGTVCSRGQKNRQTLRGSQMLKFFQVRNPSGNNHFTSPEKETLLLTQTVNLTGIPLTYMFIHNHRKHIGTRPAAVVPDTCTLTTVLKQLLFAEKALRVI